MGQTTQKREEIKRAIEAALLKHKHDVRPSFYRLRRKKAPKPLRLIAYDTETTRIKKGTPDPLYITAHGENFSVDMRVRDMPHLTQILVTQFLTEENLGACFVAWNGNRFDAYLIAAALIRESDFILHPYLTRSKALRGIRVIRAEDRNNKNARCWQFLDGIAMTGLVGTSLETFTESFAPNFKKLKGAIDFEKEEFDPENPLHRAYAYRDSEGLYHAITHAQQIMLDHFDSPLAVTMGGACIKIFQAHIPPDVVIEPLIPDLAAIVSRYVMRGGFCYCVRRYDGPVWKYDINQAYAAAMREARLPCGGAMHIKGAPPKSAKIYIARITARLRENEVPFYYRSLDDRGRVRSLFAREEIRETWLTSVEIGQLSREGWEIRFSECWVWPGDGFTMQEYVDRLERLRQTCEGGPKGAIGTMVKATGNHSYGKTVEEIAPIEFILAAECPDDAVPFYDDDNQPVEHIYYRIDEDRKPKAYHQPHLGAWITAHVRMVVRRAALAAPDAWLYADTDCAIFSRDVSAFLDIDSSRYGAWKIEEEGARYQIIAKKVYTEVTTDQKKPKRSAKGMLVKELTADDFSQWIKGIAPVQSQPQLQNFLSVMNGAEMFRIQRREGTRVESAA